jgi:hypothetical protein
MDGGINKKLNRRQFLRSTVVATAATTAIAYEASAKDKPESEFYEQGSFVDDVTKPFIDDLTAMFKGIHGDVDGENMPENIGTQVQKYLDSYAASITLAPEQRTKELDTLALFYALQDARARRALDQRVIAFLSSLVGDYLEQAARASLSSIPPPSYKAAKENRGI